MSRHAAALRAAAEEADPLLPQREQAAADLARFEEKLEAATWRAVRAWLEIATRATLTGQAVVAGPEDVPPDPSAIPAHSEEWAQLVETHIVAGVEELLGERFAELLDRDDVVSARPWQEQYLADVRNRMADLPSATFDAVRAEVQLGIDEGDGIPAIRDRIGTALSARHGGHENEWRKRATSIARTETIGAYNGGQLAAARVRSEASGVTLEKVWLATIDSRTRKDHYKADGQRVPIDQPFEIGGRELDHPGDPTAPAAQVVNCRCTMLEVEPDEETPDTGRRQLRDPAEVDQEIAAREADDQVRAYDDPEEQARQAANIAARRAEVPAPEPPVSGDDVARLFRAERDLPEDLRAACYEYREVDYRQLNDGLRVAAGDDSALSAELRQRVELLDRAITEGGASDRPAVLYRGIDNLERTLGTADPAELVGKTLTDRAYMSTSARQETARYFGTPATEEHLFARGTGGAVLRINAPAGTRALRLAEWEGDTEAEVLLARGSALRVVRSSTEELWGQDWHVLDVEVVQGDDLRAAVTRAAQEAAEAAAKLAAEVSKKAAAAARKRERKLAATSDDAGYPMRLTYEYLVRLDEDALDDLGAHLAARLDSADPVEGQRWDDYETFTDYQARESEVIDQALSTETSDAAVTRIVEDFQRTDGKPGLTHPAVGGRGSSGRAQGQPTRAEVQLEWSYYLDEQMVKAEAATRGKLLTAKGEKRGMSARELIGGDPMQAVRYASPELLEYWETNRRMSWSEFYYERTGSPGSARAAANQAAINSRIDRDRSVLRAAAGSPAEEPEPTAEQLATFAAGQAAFTAGQPVTVCPYPGDPELLRLWCRGYAIARRDARLAELRAADELPEQPPRRETADRLHTEPGDFEITETERTEEEGPAGVTAAATPEGPPMPRRTWRSAPYLAPFAKPTGDGRIFAVGGLTARDLPLPLLYQESTAMGHDGSTTVGRILAIEFTDAGVVASGDYLDDPAFAEAVGKAIALVEAGLGGVSVDLDSVVGSLVDENGDPVDMEWLIGEWEKGENPTVYEQVDEGRLIATTQVATPAFAEAAIVLDPIEDAPEDDADDVEPAEVASVEEQIESITAAAGQLFRPPASAYEDPKLTGPTALTVTDEGRVFGHVAVWGTCHVGYPGQCVEPPRSPSEYAYFHTGAVRLDDGSRIAVGNLTLGGGHADPKWAWRQAARHYDETGYGVATVRAYEDEFGVAVAGWLNPGATPEQIAELERSPLSGDWREIGGELDMIGALAVNSGGFPIPRYATGASGDRLSLVAAPGVRPDPGRKRGQGVTLAALRANLRREVLRDVRQELSRRARLDRIVASVGLDPASRLADVLASIDD